MAADPSFAQHCCELLAPTVGPCVAKRMFGGWGISADGRTLAIVADLGDGITLWLKGDEETRASFEDAGCRRFTYEMQGVPRSMGYYSAPEEALESPQLMAPWARQALASAVRQSGKATRSRTATTSQASRTKPATRRAAAPAPKATASRKSAKG